jgi:preprotein translocase subunit SecE
MTEQVERVKAFVAEVGQEVRRVTWPTGREIAGATAVVIAATAIVAVLLAIYDLVVSRVLGIILQ